MTESEHDLAIAAIRGAIRDIKDFPHPGITFKDITPLLREPALLQRCIELMAMPFVGDGITHVAAIESRGFILGAPIALRLDAAFVPVRKAGKLPYSTRGVEYALEYGTGALEIHSDALEDVPSREGGGEREGEEEGEGEGGAEPRGALVGLGGGRARVLVVDDVLATGGTAEAACRLVTALGGDIAGCSFLLALAFLQGLERLSAIARVEALLRY